jgi:hypothetical protein
VSLVSGRRAIGRRGGTSLADVVLATSIVVTVVGVVGAEVGRQHRDLASARAEDRAQAALRSAWERLRGRTLALPLAGAPLEVSRDAHVTVTLSRHDGLERTGALRRPNLVPVVLVATWRDGAHGARESRLEGLLPGEGR